jgi:hypothetical protein
MKHGRFALVVSVAVTAAIAWPAVKRVGITPGSG